MLRKGHPVPLGDSAWHSEPDVPLSAVVAKPHAAGEKQVMPCLSIGLLRFPSCSFCRARALRLTKHLCPCEYT